MTARKALIRRGKIRPCREPLPAIRLEEQALEPPTSPGPGPQRAPADTQRLEPAKHDPTTVAAQPFIEHSMNRGSTDRDEHEIDSVEHLLVQLLASSLVRIDLKVRN